MSTSIIFGPKKFPEAEVFNIDPGTRKTFIVLNETDKLSNGFHIGPEAVCTKIRVSLAERGFGYAGWANSLKGAVFLHENLSSKPSLVVLNGEGTMHHNAPRAFTLLALAEHFKKSGSVVVLINSAWENNSSFLGDYLSCFDLVTGRDSYAVKNMRKWRSDARIVPDLSLSVFSGLGEASRKPERLERIGVIDNVVGGVGEALQDFSDREHAPFFVMGPGRLDSLRMRCYKRKLTRFAWPEVLREKHLGKHESWITGRYHGLIAAICYGKPCVALSSNTSKIEGLLEMLGCPKVLLPKTWSEYSPDAQRNEIMIRLQSWNKDQWSVVRDNISKMRGDIEKLFDDITVIVNQVKR